MNALKSAYYAGWRAGMCETNACPLTGLRRVSWLMGWASVVRPRLVEWIKKRRKA